MRIVNHQFSLKLNDPKREVYDWFVAHAVIIDGARARLKDHKKFDIVHEFGETIISHFGCAFPNPLAVVRYLEDYSRFRELTDIFVFTSNKEVRDDDGISYTNDRWVITSKGSRKQNHGEWMAAAVKDIRENKSELAKQLHDIILATSDDFQEQTQNHIDELVSQSYSIDASNTNNQGMLHQIQYLLENDMEGSVRTLINTLDEFEKYK